MSSGSSPTGEALIRLVGAVLAEQHDERAESRRCVALDVLSKSRADQSSPTEREDTLMATSTTPTSIVWRMHSMGATVAVLVDKRGTMTNLIARSGSGWQPQTSEWPGPGSNRRPSAFQADARTN